MRRLAIEINDAGIVVADESGVLRVEPGFAVVERGRILTGTEAFSLSRLRPRAVSSTHWVNLSIEPGTATVPGGYSTAELAHAQLERLWRETGNGADEVIFVVPGILDGAALGVLLGLAEDCAMPTSAIVDAAAAASVRPWPDRQLVHVDADLHSVFVTTLTQGENAVAEAPIRLDSMGLSGVMDAFAHRLAEIFVLATRFDPLHEASAEQLLYDALPAALAAVYRDGKATIALEGPSATFEISVERNDFAGAVRGFNRAVRQLIAQNRRPQAALVLQLSDRLAGLPGIDEELKRLDATTVIPLARGHAALSALASAAALPPKGKGVRLYRQLAWREAPTVSAAAPETTSPEPAGPPPAGEQRPTHVVYRGIAYPVNGKGLVIGRAKLDARRAIIIESRAEGVSRAHCELAVIDGEMRLRDLSSHGTFVNDRRIQGHEVLKPADVIRVGSPGAELTLIRVEDDDAA